MSTYKQDPGPTTRLAPVRWSPPPENLYKSNFDADFGMGRFRGGVPGFHKYYCSFEPEDCKASNSDGRSFGSKPSEGFS